MHPLSPAEVWLANIDRPACDMQEYMLLIRKIARGKILEIGLRDGVSTACFILGLHDKGENATGHVYSVDIEDRNAGIFSDPCWTFIHGNSLDPDVVQHIVQDVGSCNIVLIDGDHRRPSVRSDLNRYGALVRPGGLLMVHDVDVRVETPPDAGLDWPTIAVREEYEEFLRAAKNWQSLIMPGKFGLGIAKRPIPG